MIPWDGSRDSRGEQIETLYGRRARLSFLDFLDFAWLAAELVARGKQAYDADVQLRLAGEAIVHKLGESVTRLPASIVEAQPEIPFRGMKAMRNLIAHEYDHTDPEIVWQTLSVDLPLVAAQITSLVDRREIILTRTGIDDHLGSTSTVPVRRGLLLSTLGGTQKGVAADAVTFAGQERKDELGEAIGRGQVHPMTDRERD